MAELIETRWKRYGKDRVYLKTVDGADVGHIDLTSRSIVATSPEHEPDLRACLARWTRDAQQTPAVSDREANEAPVTAPHIEEPLPGELVAGCDPLQDLAGNVAGAAARTRRDEVNAQAPVRNFVARILGVKTDERAWRVGAKGEEKVAAELGKLGAVWQVLHAIEVGRRGSDIDHLVIGPAGVFTLNAKRHPNGSAWVAEHSVRVNGQRTDYLRNSRFEAQRAARLLSAACGRDISVRAVVVFVDLDKFTVKQMPADVHVTTRRRLKAWLRSLPTTLGHDDVQTIYAQARRRSTWS